MPFISDDFEWKLVGDNVPYDKSRFVVVRKLRVKPNKRTVSTQTMKLHLLITIFVFANCNFYSFLFFSHFSPFKYFWLIKFVNILKNMVKLSRLKYCRPKNLKHM